METDAFVYLPVPMCHKLETVSKEHGEDYSDPPNLEIHPPPDSPPVEHPGGENLAPRGKEAYTGIDEHDNLDFNAAEKPCPPIDHHTKHAEGPGKKVAVRGVPMYVRGDSFAKLDEASPDTRHNGHVDFPETVEPGPGPANAVRS